MSPGDSGTTSTDARRRMVRRQLRDRGIHDERVLAAMAEVPRELFVPPELRRRAYRDGALRIGEGQTISQPWIVACMAQALELRGHERVLEVGTGSGYSAAVLSRLCAEVVTIERFPSLARAARRAAGRARATKTWRCATATARSARRTGAVPGDLGHRHRHRRAAPGPARPAGSGRNPRVPGGARRARAAACGCATERRRSLASVRFVPLVAGRGAG